MRKSLSLETMFGDVPFYERFAKARAAGFDFVELDDWIDLDITRVKEQLHANRLLLTSISGERNEYIADSDRHGDFLEYLSQSIAIAKDFSCTSIVVASEAEVKAAAKFGVDPKRDVAMVSAVTRVLDDAAKKAMRSGLTLLVKPDVVGNPAGVGMLAAGELIAVVNSPAIRLVYGMRPAALRNEAALAMFRKYRDLLDYVHVDDSVELSASWSNNGDLSRLARVLHDELGYKGTVGFRLHTVGREERCIEGIQKL